MKSLTSRQKEIMDLVVDGVTKPADIASRLGVSRSTVYKHLHGRDTHGMGSVPKGIFVRLGARNMTEAAMVYLRDKGD